MISVSWHRRWRVRACQLLRRRHRAFDVSLGDIDNDGDLDAVIADITNDAVGILTNDGSGAFSIGSLPSRAEAHAPQAD